MLKRKFSAKEGFTLIEIAIVLVIGGILFGTLFGSLNAYMRNIKAETTKERIKLIDRQLQRHLEQSGSFPCPAPFTAAPDTSAYGFGTTDCADNDPVEGTFRAAGRNGRTVTIGAIPIRDLNLPDEFGNDGYGNRLIYAVTDVLTKNATYNRDLGAISIIDTQGNSVVVPDDSAHYVISSAGANRYGAYNSDGIMGFPCPGDAETLDQENCDNDAVFRTTLLTSDAEGINEYDDMLAYRSTSDFGQAIPADAVVAFDLATCPRGWTAATTRPSDTSTLIYCKKL